MCLIESGEGDTTGPFLEEMPKGWVAGSDETMFQKAPDEEELKGTDLPRESLAEPDQIDVHLLSKIHAVQTHLKGMDPNGIMTVRGKDIVYLTKHQIIASLKPLLLQYHLLVLYRGIDKIEVIQEKLEMYGQPLRETLKRQERVWVRFSLFDVVKGGHCSAVVPADVIGYDNTKAMTVAMAFAQRDFLALVFAAHIDDNAGITEEDEAMSDFTPRNAARNMTMDDINETLRLKTKRMLEIVPVAKLMAEAKARGLKFSSLKVEDMTPTTMWEIIDIGMDVTNPNRAKSHLKAVGQKGQASTEEAPQAQDETNATE